MWIFPIIIYYYQTQLISRIKINFRLIIDYNRSSIQHYLWFSKHLSQQLMANPLKTALLWTVWSGTALFVQMVFEFFIYYFTVHYISQSISRLYVHAEVSKLVFLVAKLKPLVAKQNIEHIWRTEPSSISLFLEPQINLLYPYPILRTTFIKSGIYYSVSSSSQKRHGKVSRKMAL